MRINLTKKDIINSAYMRIGFSKNISDNILDDLLYILSDNLIKKEKVKISNFGTFQVKNKDSRIGRNPKTKEEKLITARKVISFKASNEFKKYINSDRKI
tara:strand:- start:149 stop:448 length:300 start_codon:yes stop_codon:yes gene_type:complete